MTDFKNQEQPVKLSKNERPSANQVDAGALPIVPITTGKNYYSENDDLSEKIYSINVHDPAPNFLAVWITGSILSKLASGFCEYLNNTQCTYSPVFEAIGTWFNKVNENGELIVEVYYVLEHTAPPLPHSFHPLSEPIRLGVNDIDAKEEVILKFVPQDYSFPSANSYMSAIVIVFKPQNGYLAQYPVSIGHQIGPQTDITLVSVNISGGDIAIANTYANIRPLIRLYPHVNRAIRQSSVEGNAINPHSPIAETLNFYQEGSGDDLYFLSAIVGTEKHSGPNGCVRAGRIKRVTFEMNNVSVPPALEPKTVCIKLFRNGNNIITDIYDRFEICNLTITAPPPCGADATEDYLRVNNIPLKTLGVCEGMILHNASTSIYGFVIKVTESLEVVAGVLQVVSRVWALNVVSPHLLVPWAIGNTARFSIMPVSLVAPPNIHRPAFHWDIDTPFQLYDEDLTNGYSYKLYSKISILGGNSLVGLAFRLNVNIEEDNFLYRCNPAKILSGSEDVSEKW